jgi:hypothetical protein
MSKHQRNALIHSLLVVSVFALTGASWPAVAGTSTYVGPLSPPANDGIGSAANIGSLQFNDSVNVAQATPNDPQFLDTSDPIFPAGCGETLGTRGWRTVWYTYTPTVSGVLRVDTLGSNYDTVLAIWTGSPGSLTASGCSDDASGTTQSLLDLWVTQDTLYFIEAAAYSANDSGTLDLEVKSVPQSDLVYLPLVVK